MSKKNKNKKIHKLMKEVKRKRVALFNSLDVLNKEMGHKQDADNSPMFDENSLVTEIGDYVSASTEKALQNLIDHWKNNNIRILLTTFLKDYMNQKYRITVFRWQYFSQNISFPSVAGIIELSNNEDKDERVTFCISLHDFKTEEKKKGKYCFGVNLNRTYRDPKTKYLMENMVHGSTYIDEF